MGREHRQRRLAGALPDQVIPPGRVDRRVITQAAQAAAVVELQGFAVEGDLGLEWASVADQHAIERGARERSRCALVVRDVHACTVLARPAAAVAPVGEDAFVDQQAVHALAP